MTESTLGNNSGNFSGYEPGSYTIEHQDNILASTVRGPLTPPILEQYQLDMRNACEKFHGKTWGALVTYYGGDLLTQDTEETLLNIAKHRIRHGMVANATVILESKHTDLQQMQLKRIYQNCQLEFHVFTNTEIARNWLSQYLAQQ
ncbi:hypothetical protein [Thalassomonas sp. RHCl1]|uniref:hypothetical protein n=1 Tax=Thalassomonas sp. RHCl1 TaxID=2995320 RepID=UPI00248C425A|nr:hypothetical protein [Thalassomonas sp. RHCl1]